MKIYSVSWARGWDVRPVPKVTFGPETPRGPSYDDYSAHSLPDGRVKHVRSIVRNGLEVYRETAIRPAGERYEFKDAQACAWYNEPKDIK